VACFTSASEDGWVGETVDGYRHGLWHKPSTETALGTDPAVIGQYDHGWANGPFVVLDGASKPQLVCSYKNGWLHGIQTNFDQGQRLQEANWSNGVRLGELRGWHFSGAPFVEGDWTEEYRGVEETWDERGKLIGRVDLRSGTGIYRMWAAHGELIEEGRVENGRPVGIWARYPTWRRPRLHNFDEDGEPNSSYRAVGRLHRFISLTHQLRPVPRQRASFEG